MAVSAVCVAVAGAGRDQVAPGAGAVIIVKAARLIDGRGGAPTAPAMVRVEGERISAVGSALPIPQGARVIDLGSATLLPGLIDLHTHLTGRRSVHWEDVLTKTTPGHGALWGARSALVTATCRWSGTSPTAPTR